MRPAVVLALVLATASACSRAAEPPATSTLPDYLGAVTTLLDVDLIDVVVSVRGARDRSDLTRYAECAAAQYALIRGYGFARHVRTNLSEEGGIRQADAVYTISSALPDGLRTLDAEVIVQNCREQGIPTV